MKIKLPNIDLSAFSKVYAGNRPRYATATAVAFNNRRLISAQFLSKSLHIHDEAFNITDTYKSDYYIDLIDCRGDRILASNFPSYEVKNGIVSLFEICQDKIALIKHIDLGNKKCHGCRFINNDRCIITNTANNKSIIFLNLVTEEFTEFKDFEYYPKDIYLKDDFLYIISSASRPEKVKTEIRDSVIYKYELSNMKKIKELKFFGQTDCMTFCGEDILITLQGQDSLAHIKETADGFIFIREIGGFSFPHGISSLEDNIVVTNYGDNSLDYLRIEELL